MDFILLALDVTRIELLLRYDTGNATRRGDSALTALQKIDRCTACQLRPPGARKARTLRHDSFYVVTHQRNLISYFQLTTLSFSYNPIAFRNLRVPSSVQRSNLAALKVYGTKYAVRYSRLRGGSVGW